MRSISFFLLSLLPLLASFTLARPTLVDRDFDGTSYQVWGQKGPSVRDVKQVKTLNCWWAACSLSVLISNQEWIKSMMKHGDGSALEAVFPQDNALQVSLWNPNTGARYSHTADVSQRSPTEDRGNENWWHDAFSQSVRAMGTHDSILGILPTGEFDGNSGSATTGLKILTGYDTAETLQQHYGDISNFIADLNKAVTGTPVIINTVSEEYMKETTPQLGHSHDYAVYNVSTGEQGEQTVWVRNSWGITEQFKVQDVFDNMWKTVYLAGFVPLGTPSSDWPPPDNSVAPIALPSNTAAAAAAANATATPANSTDATSVPAASGNETATSVSSDATATATSAPAAGSSAPAATSAPGDPSSAAPGPSSAPGSSAPADGAGAAQNSAVSAPASTGVDAPAATAQAAGINEPWQWTSTLPGLISSWTSPATPLFNGFGAVAVGTEATGSASDSASVPSSQPGTTSGAETSSGPASTSVDAAPGVVAAVQTEEGDGGSEEQKEAEEQPPCKRSSPPTC